jgi:hypothetical protein
MSWELINSVTGEPGKQKETNGAAHVTDEIAPSSYTGQKATSTTAASVAIATGAMKLRIVNEGATAGDFVRIAFGESEADAETNAAYGEPVMPTQKTTIRIPANATHIGYKAGANTPNITLTQGK